MASPDYVHGKICYIAIPTEDVARSAAFYSSVFGWNIRTRGDGSTAFDDSAGQVSGSWITGRPPAREISLSVHIMVANLADTLDRVIAQGGEVVWQSDAGSPEVYAYFRDPAGNVLGAYQEPTLARATAHR